jgi:hypothetical protein
VKSEDTPESILKKLDSDYGLSNLYPVGRPESLMGNAKVLTLTTSMRGDTIKIDGPGLVVFRVYDELLKINGKIKSKGK